MLYDQTVGRLRLEMLHERDGGNATLTVLAGWNDSVPRVRNEITREELHDLRYLIDRALAAVK
jgi:hypothetical protein